MLNVYYEVYAVYTRDPDLEIFREQCQMIDHVCCYFRIHILRTEAGRVTRNSFQYFLELFKMKKYFGTEIMTNQVFEKTLNVGAMSV